MHPGSHSVYYRLYTVLHDVWPHSHVYRHKAELESMDRLINIHTHKYRREVGEYIYYIKGGNMCQKQRSFPGIISKTIWKMSSADLTTLQIRFTIRKAWYGGTPLLFEDPPQHLDTAVHCTNCSEGLLHSAKDWSPASAQHKARPFRSP